MLDGALLKLGVRSEVRNLRLQQAFAEILGPVLSPMCVALRLEKKTLVLATANTALSHQLQMDSLKLIDAINRRMGGPLVTRFRFVPLAVAGAVDQRS